MYHSHIADDHRAGRNTALKAFSLPQTGIQAAVLEASSEFCLCVELPRLACCYPLILIRKRFSDV